MKHLPLITALIGASLSTTALAGHHSEAGFFKRDLNNDGVVSKVEYLKATESKFAKMDANGDGVISKAEYEESRKKWKKHKKDKKDKKDKEQ